MSMDLKPNLTKRTREEPPGADSPAAKRIRDDLLGLLDDFDSVPAGDLESVMRSLDQEISGANTLPSDSGDSVPELGYLLEASDDELGLPTANMTPKGSSSGCGEAGKEDQCCAAELVRVPSVCSGPGGFFWALNEEVASYDSFGLGGDVNGDYGKEEDDYLALDGIFDTSDVNHGGSNCRGMSWGRETLPVL